MLMQVNIFIMRVWNQEMERQIALGIGEGIKSATLFVGMNGLISKRMSGDGRGWTGMVRGGIVRDN